MLCRLAGMRSFPGFWTQAGYNYKLKTMAKIVVIGNSAAGFSACQRLVALGLKEVTVVTRENTIGYYKPRILDYLSSVSTEKEISICAQDFYALNNINLLKNSQACRLDTKKQRLILKDNTKINYDYLIIASGVRQELGVFTGKNKEGVFVLNGLEDAIAIKKRLLVTNTICLIAELSLSLRLAQIFFALGKEVKLISESPAILPEPLLSSGKVELIMQAAVQEFIGDGAQLQAVKLNSGKVIAADMAIFAGGYTPCTAFLKETDVKMENGYILVDDAMRSNIDNIFACGSVCKKTSSMDEQKNWEQAWEEGSLAAVEVAQSIERSKAACQTF